MNTSRYVVTGLTCAHCVSAVTEEVRALDGVDDVTVDLASGQLSVTSRTEIPYADVAAAVDEAGYALAPA